MEMELLTFLQKEVYQLLYETPVNIAGQEFIGVDTSISYRWVTDAAGDFSFSITNTNQIDMKYAEDVGDPL